MQDLSNEFGSQKPFNDDELFATITRITYPEVGAFLEKYVAGETPIPYDFYFAKMGVKNAKVQIPGNPFLKDERTPYIRVDQSTKEIIALPIVNENSFMTSIGIKGEDHILAINGTAYNFDNIYDLIMASESFKEGENITVKISRDGKELDLTGKIVLPKTEKDGFMATDKSKESLKNAWLKG